MTISEGGRIEQIAGHGPDLSGEGQQQLRRASWVEPCSLPLRLAFHLLRRWEWLATYMTDGDPHEDFISAWTRSWRCHWRVRIIGGPVLAGTWRDRAEAIAAEVAWLERERFGA